MKKLKSYEEIEERILNLKGNLTMKPMVQYTHAEIIIRAKFGELLWCINRSE